MSDEASLLALPLVSTLANAEVAVRRFIGKQMSVRSIRKEQVSVLKDLKSLRDGFHTFMEDHESVVAGPMHVTVADSLIDVTAFGTTTVQRQSQRIFTVFGESWSADLLNLTNGINNWCPAWEPARDSLLTNRALVQAFIGMPENTSSTRCSSCLSQANGTEPCVTYET